MNRKIPVIKMLRHITGLGLKDAKYLVDQLAAAEEGSDYCPEEWYNKFPVEKEDLPLPDGYLVVFPDQFDSHLIISTGTVSETEAENKARDMLLGNQLKKKAFIYKLVAEFTSQDVKVRRVKEDK